jgi:transcription termination factor Rho
LRIGIEQHGIAYRRQDGGVTLIRPSANGRAWTEVEVAEELAEQYRLSNGDIIEGETEDIPNPAFESEAAPEDEFEQFDEPAKLRGHVAPEWLVTRVLPTEQLQNISRINGLSLEEAQERPYAREKRSAYERAAPDRHIPLATGPNDTTGRILDFGATFGQGYAGIIYGPHGSGLTRALNTVVKGVTANAPDIIVLILLLRARGEEITDWRRRFPEADIVVAPVGQMGATPEQTLRMADLTLEAARRQTELGRHVLLAVDSLTGLWGAMLEAEEADVQRRADQAYARQRIREWIQSAGSFSGEGLLGSGPGGSLTLVGTVWHQSVDSEEEEEGEMHPHLRLMEHILHETGWRVPLSGALASRRLFPAIETARCLSQSEEHLLDPQTFEKLRAARQSLASLEPTARYNRLMDALDDTDNQEGLIGSLGS